MQCMSPKNKFYLVAISLIMLCVAVANPKDDCAQGDDVGCCGALADAGPPVQPGRREALTFGAFFTGARAPGAAASAGRFKAPAFPLSVDAGGGGVKPGCAFGRSGTKRARTSAVAPPALGFAMGDGGTTAAPPSVAGKK
jgi:hypothetical protein